MNDPAIDYYYGTGGDPHAKARAWAALTNEERAAARLAVPWNRDGQ